MYPSVDAEKPRIDPRSAIRIRPGISRLNSQKATNLPGNRAVPAAVVLIMSPAPPRACYALLELADQRHSALPHAAGEQPFHAKA
jgi:hypothetical protein